MISQSFLFVMSQLVKKVPMKTESYISLGGAIILLALFAQNNIKFHSALQNFAKNESGFQYLPHMRLKMNRRKLTPLYKNDTKIVQWRLLPSSKLCLGLVFVCNKNSYNTISFNNMFQEENKTFILRLASKDNKNGFVSTPLKQLCLL